MFFKDIDDFLKIKIWLNIIIYFDCYEIIILYVKIIICNENLKIDEFYLEFYFDCSNYVELILSSMWENF